DGARNGRQLELIAAGDHFGRNLLGDEKRLVVLVRLLHALSSWGRLRERAKSYAKALANDILR
ncbi:hypothetical protein C5U31_09755, partial [Acinetobacter baumannii]